MARQWETEGSGQVSFLPCFTRISAHCFAQTRAFRQECRWAKRGGLEVTKPCTEAMVKKGANVLTDGKDEDPRWSWL